MSDQGARTTRAAERQRQAEALRALARQTSRTGSGVRSPAELAAVRAFGNEGDLLLAVQQRWQVHLLAQLDQVLEQGVDDQHDAVLQAVHELSRALPGLAGLLEQHAHDPVLAVGRQTLAGYLDQACPCGRSHLLVDPAPRPGPVVTRATPHRRVTAMRRRLTRRVTPARAGSEHVARSQPVAG